MQVNEIAIGVIGAFAIIGATTIIELLFRTMIKLVSLKSQEAAFKLSMATDSGLQLQLGTSLCFSRSRLMENSNCRCNQDGIKHKQLSGKRLVIISSAACMSLILLSQIAIIFSSQSTIRYETMKERKYEVFSIGKGAPVTLRDITNNSAGQLEIGVSNITEGFSKRYKCTAFLHPFLLNPEVFASLLSASNLENTEFRIISETFEDGKNFDGSVIDQDTNRRRVVNQWDMYLGTHSEASPMIGIYPIRKLDTLDSSQKEMFTDFQEADAQVIEKALFAGLGLACKNFTSNYINHRKTTEFSCDTRKVKEKFNEHFPSKMAAFERARADAAMQLFRVQEFSGEVEVALDESNHVVPGKEVDGIVTRITEFKSSTTKFYLLCIAAGAGLLRILSGIVIDFRKTAEDFLIMSSHHEVGTVGPGNWDGIQYCPFCKDEFS